MWPSVSFSVLLAISPLPLAAVATAFTDVASRATIVGRDVVLETYDYVIIGGGTSGLTVADRLSEDPNGAHFYRNSFPYSQSCCPRFFIKP